jgi:hypothetical protein
MVGGAYSASADWNITKNAFWLKLSNIARCFGMHISARADKKEGNLVPEFAMQSQAAQLIMHLDSNGA